MSVKMETCHMGRILQQQQQQLLMIIGASLALWLLVQGSGLTIIKIITTNHHHHFWLAPLWDALEFGEITVTTTLSCCWQPHMHKVKSIVWIKLKERMKNFLKLINTRLETAWANRCIKQYALIHWWLGSIWEFLTRNVIRINEVW